MSGKNLNFRIQYRSSLKNIYSVLLFSEFHMSLISHGSVNLYSYIQLLILLIWFSFVFVYWRYIVFSFALLINLPTIPPFLCGIFWRLYVACLASLLNCIIIYIFIYEHFFLANNKIYKLICVIWAIIYFSFINNI